MVFQGQKASLQRSSSAGMFLYVLFAFWVSTALSGSMKLQNVSPIPACAANPQGTSHILAWPPGQDCAL